MSTFCVNDLTLDELREWIADWCVVENLFHSTMSVADIGAWEDWSNPEDRGAALWELRDELLEAYADRLRESVAHPEHPGFFSTREQTSQEEEAR